jgi:Sigma-70, region 4
MMSFLVLIDPNVMAKIFRAPEPDVESELTEALDVEVWRSQLTEMLPKLPAREADMVELYYIKHKVQADIGFILGISQPAVSYILDRATERMLFMVRHPMPDLNQMRLDVRFLEKRDCEILISWCRTSSQTVTARNLGYTQATVRDRLTTAVTQLCIAGGTSVPAWLQERAPVASCLNKSVTTDEEYRARMHGYAEYSLALWANPNIYHWVRRIQHPDPTSCTPRLIEHGQALGAF